MKPRRKRLRADHRKQRGRIPCEFQYRHRKRRGEAGNKYVSPMELWAENEIRLACQKENPDWDGESFDYGIACYQSALKAYKALMSDGHSGFSWQLTRNILERLMRNEPLTPITDADFENLEPVGDGYNFKEYQCPRLSSLFKKVYDDGRVEYSDIDRYFCYEITDSNNTYIDSRAGNILNKLRPITLPYYPSKEKYQICCETFLTDGEFFDYDTCGYWRIITPEMEIIPLYKFYKEVKDGEPVVEKLMSASYIKEDGTVIEGQEYTHEYQPTNWVEITQEEFEERRANKIEAAK